MLPAAAPPSTLPTLRIAGTGAATTYALELLHALGWPCRRAEGPADPAPGLAWARSGAMALTGEPDGAPLPAPAAVASCADGAARALTALAGAATGAAPRGLDGGALLGERAALATPPLARRGVVSPGGSARLLACADGWLALSLPRPEDARALPAWLELEPDPTRDPWALASAVSGRRLDDLVARGRLVGLALAAVPTRAAGDAGWCRIAAEGPARPVPGRPPVVIDLSSLWAGPLCGQLLASCGMRVVKLESRERPDGARRGPAAFFRLLNGGKESVALSLDDEADLAALRGLLARADVVIESSRPRALRHLGIHAESFVEGHGVTWLSITAHGRREPEADWIGFGDDTAAGAGLVATSADGPRFLADAVADPLTGLHAAAAVLATFGAGRPRLLDLSLHGVSSRVRAVPAGGECSPEAAAPPRARPVPRRAAPDLGADTARVLRALDVPC